jgi:hypothetical protein
VSVRAPPQKRSEDLAFLPDSILTLKTAAGPRALYVVVKTSHLDRSTADQYSRAIRDNADQWLLLAPVLGRPLRETLTQRGINFLDRQGNCFIRLGPNYVAMVHGRETPRRPKPKGIRSPGYRVLFALLARRELLNEPVRSIAKVAGVSPQTASDMRARLLAERLVMRGASRMSFIPHRFSDALDLWISGYRSVLRPDLVVGRFRTPDREPEGLEARLAENLRGSRWRLGGSAAAYRLSGHYRGPNTVVHVEDFPEDTRVALRAIPDPNGPLIVTRFPGPVALEGLTSDTAHPLLVYSEMLVEGSEREIEAATEIRERYLAVDSSPDRSPEKRAH